MENIQYPISNIQYPISRSKREELNMMLKSNSIFNSINLSTGERRESGGGMNIFLTQNLGKGPPGRTRGPVGTGCLKPDDQPAAPKSSDNQIINEKLSMKFNHLINIKNSIYYKHLNSLIMKKQILFIALFLLAAFVSVNKSYGQCTPGPLSPAAGVEYDYGVTITGTNTSPTFLWYATTDVNLITGTKLLTTDNYFTVGGGSAYNNTVGGTANIKLTWLPKALSTTFYLVVKYTETSAPGCTVENMKVFEIKPINTFLLAIAGSNATGAALQDANCVAGVTAALVTAATPTVKFTYGPNTIYYKITASGILGDWRPTVRIPALAGDQTYASARWSSDNGTTWGAVTGFTAASGATQDLGLAVDATVTLVAGSSYLVELVINNNDYETLADQVLNVKVDGFLPTAYTVSDIQGAPSATPCAPAPVFDKNADYTITHRPTITPAVVTTILIPKLP